MSDNSDAPPLRYAVVGVGAVVYEEHQHGLALESSRVVAVCDVNRQAAEEVAVEWRCPAFTDYRNMLAEIEADVVVITTPHKFHAPIAIASLEAGCHVLVEKPIAVHIAEADAMLDAAQRTGKLLAVNFQQRTRPEVMAARRFITDGKLGIIQHIDIKMSWTRTQTYYRSGGWRGTWRGEGGGVLLNQAPHELDLLCYLIGVPARVVAWTRTIAHVIETEDTVQAMFEWENGVLGSLHISTAEAGQPQHIRVVGTGGHMALYYGGLEFNRFEIDLLEYLKTSERTSGSPALLPQEIELGESKGKHVYIYQNLYEAIVNGVPLVADGASAAQSLELANAMTYSSYTGKTLELPLNRDKYAALLADLQAGRTSIHA